MNKPLITGLTLTICLLCPPASANHSSGARAMALSNAFVSISDTWSTAHNQATLSMLSRFSTGVFHEARFGLKELSLTAASLVYPNERGTFGFYLSQFGVHSYKEHKIGFAFARKVSRRMGLGLQLDYLSIRVPEHSSPTTGITFELGCLYAFNGSTALAFHTFNPIKEGLKTQGYTLTNKDITFRMGGHHQIDKISLICTEYFKHSDQPGQLRAGLEVSPLKGFDLRIGMSGKPYKLSSGLGFSFGRIQADMAFTYNNNLGLTPSISIQYQP